MLLSYNCSKKIFFNCVTVQTWYHLVKQLISTNGAQLLEIRRKLLFLFLRGGAKPFEESRGKNSTTRERLSPQPLSNALLTVEGLTFLTSRERKAEVR